MFDRTRVASGFDIEVLISERYLTYVVLAQIEAGKLDTTFDVIDPDSETDLSIILHPPVDYNVLYRDGESPELPNSLPGAFLFELLPEDAGAFMHVKAIVTIIDRANGNTFPELQVGLLLNVALESEETDNGLEKNHELVLEFVGFDDFTRDLIATIPDTEPDEVEDSLRPFVDRRIPLGIARGQRVHRLRIQKHFSSDKRSLGIYLDLALRSGPEPESLLEPRGEIALAQDFRESDSDIAFSTSPDLFSLVGPDIKFRQAEEDPEDGSFSLRKNPEDTNSEVIGRIKNISVRPHILRPPNQPPIVTGALAIDLHGEYTDALGDPDFHLLLLLDPKAIDWIVELDLDVKVDLGLLATLLLVAAGIALTFMFAPGIGWGSGVLAGSLIGAAVLRGLIVQPLAAKLIEDRIDEDTEASFLDVLPFRIPAAQRRWDPFYETEHQVVALVETITVDEQGFAFEATDLVLDKQPIPLKNAVIRDKQLSGTRVTALRYRVSDFTRITDDLEASAPGRDRMEFTQADPATEPTLIDLTLGQISERIEAGRLLAPITYTPERIHLVHNQIDHMLTLSRRERVEAKSRLINRFRADQSIILLEAFGDLLERSVRADLEDELGRPPTEEEVQEAIDQFLTPILDSLQSLFETAELPQLLEQEVLRNLRFELVPEQYVEMQNAGILIIDGKEIIVRHNSDGSTTPYFRDRPDGDPQDNLLELPTYAPPFVVPD